MRHYLLSVPTKKIKVVRTKSNLCKMLFYWIVFYGETILSFGEIFTEKKRVNILGFSWRLYILAIFNSSNVGKKKLYPLLFR